VPENEPVFRPGLGSSDHIASPDTTDSGTATTRGVAVGKHCRSGSTANDTSFGCAIGARALAVARRLVGHPREIGFLVGTTRPPKSEVHRSQVATEEASGGAAWGMGPLPMLSVGLTQWGRTSSDFLIWCTHLPAKTGPPLRLNKWPGFSGCCVSSPNYTCRGAFTLTRTRSRALGRAIQTDPGSAPIKTHYVLFRCP